MLWILFLMVYTISLQLFEVRGTVSVSKLFFVWPFQNKRNRLIFRPKFCFISEVWRWISTTEDYSAKICWSNLNKYQLLLTFLGDQKTKLKVQRGLRANQTILTFCYFRWNCLKLWQGWKKDIWSIEWNWKSLKNLVRHLQLWIRP